MPEAPASSERLLSWRFVLVVACGLAYFLSLGVLLPVLPRFVDDGLGGGPVAVGIAVGAFSFGAVLLRPFAGLIGDRAGRRILIVVGGLVAALATLLYHLASSVEILVGVRILAGLGEAAFFVGAGTMATDLAPEERRGEAISYWSVAVYGGLAFGPFVGEVILGDDHWGRAWTLAAVLAAVAGLLGLLTRETLTDPAPRGTRPPLFHRGSLVPGSVLFLGMVALAGFAEFIPLYVDDVGLGESRSVFLLYGLLILGVRIFGARIPDRAGPLRAGTIAAGGISVGMFVLAVVASPMGVYSGTIAFSIGMSLLYPAVLTLALTGVSEAERGSSVGTVSSFFDLSQGVGAVLLGGVAAIAGIRGAFGVAAALALLGLVLLRSGVDPRVRRPVDHDAATTAAETPDAEVP